MTQSRHPHLLVAINGNLGEWRDTLTAPPDRPRLPLPYAFGAALMSAGVRLSAIDLGAAAGPGKAQANDTTPFEAIYPADQLAEALGATDSALLWGRPGLSALAKQVLQPWMKRRVLYFSYVWKTGATSTARQRIKSALARQASRTARGVVLMTAEQAGAARAALPGLVRVVQLTAGIDCDFYAGPTALSDIDEADRKRVERLLKAPYVIMPGDELRLNEDALAIVENNPLNLVRVSQYGHKNAISELKSEIRRRDLGDRLLIFERISYPALRFLMTHAVAYAGLVDASWQPAGWTVACESLACGLPAVLYEGLCTRELVRLGATSDILHSVPMRDTRVFTATLRSLAEDSGRNQVAARARAFAATTLNLERTGAAFGERLLRAIGAE